MYKKKKDGFLESVLRETIWFLLIKRTTNLMTNEKCQSLILICSFFVHFTRRLVSDLSSLRDGSKVAKSLMVLGLVFMNSSRSSNPKRNM